MHNFLDAFYLSRIGIRMLIGQYLELREPPKPDHIGLVCLVRLPFEPRYIYLISCKQTWI